MSAVRIPIPRPIELNPDARGGIDAEELRRTKDRAEAFAEVQRTENVAALSTVDAQRQIAAIALEEARYARTISARAATVRSEATRNLALGLGAGVLGVLLFGPLLFSSTKEPSCSPSRQ